MITKHSFPLKTAHKSLWFLASSSCMKRNPCSQQSPTRTPQVTAKGLSQTDALKMPRVRPQYPVPGARPSRIPAPRSWSYLNIKVVQLLSLPFSCKAVPANSKAKIPTAAKPQITQPVTLKHVYCVCSSSTFIYTKHFSARREVVQVSGTAAH